MSVLYRAQGIVLGRRDHKEVDRFYSIYTKEHGKIECLARGGHKALAKLTPHLESIAEVELLLVKGRYYDTIAGVDRLYRYRLEGTVQKQLLAQHALQFIEMGTKVMETDDMLYAVLGDWLQFLETMPEVDKERSAFLLGSLVMKLVALYGYRPELHHCLHCKTQVAQGKYRWHALRGGVVCTNCAQSDEEQFFAARTLSDDSLKLIRFALSEPFEEQLKPHLKGSALSGFHEALESLVISHFPTIPAVSVRAACALI